MGLFGAIGRKLQEAQERGRLEAEPTVQRIEERDLAAGARLLCDQLPHLSLTAKPVVMQAYRRKIQDANLNEIYDAFRDMHERYEWKKDIYAFNISQWLGQRLAEEGDSRVVEKTGSDGTKTLYYPR